MKVIVYPSELSGNIMAPASKSAMQRACAASLLSKQKIIIHNPGKSNDDKAALEIIKRLGASINEVDSETIEIESSFLSDMQKEKISTKEISCGESGLSIRMFTPITALCRNEIIVTGEGSLTTRPLDFFEKVFPLLTLKSTLIMENCPLKLKVPYNPEILKLMAR